MAKECYLESLVRTDLPYYDSLTLRIRNFKFSTNPECNCVVLRVWKHKINPHLVKMTLHPSGKRFTQFNVYDPPEISTDNLEIMSMARQVIDTRDITGLRLIMDRMVDELNLIPDVPFWYRQWKEIVDTKCTKPTEYLERTKIGYHNLTLPDIKVVTPDTSFNNVWQLLAKDGLVDEIESGQYHYVLNKWKKKDMPNDNLGVFIMQSLYT